LTHFKLFLQDENGVRTAEYDPYVSTLFWSDTKEEVVPNETNRPSWEKILKTSPQNPAGKSRSLKKIKIQMGFACNYSCTYCSQNNQRSPMEEGAKVAIEKIPAFFDKMPTWFDGGEDGKGKDVIIEFWGGETLLYWPAVKIMAERLRDDYPNISLALFTNGSLVKKDMVDFSLSKKLHFIVSHDGPTFSEDRAIDPFDIPAQAENLHYLFKVLNPEKLISFNAAVSPKNYSLIKIRKYIAEKLGVEPKNVSVTYDLVTPYDKPGLDYVTKSTKRRDLINNLFSEMVQFYPFDMSLGMTDYFINDFFESLRFKKIAEEVGQKCSMDLPSSLALDLDGNVLTCQNVTAKGGHKIGHVDEYAEVKLKTAFHWSERVECVKCPVVQICKGSCMFLKDDLWKSACDQHFTWGLAYFSLALFLQTNRMLVKIEGNNIRNSEDSVIDVLYT
jgi:uncharacterized protein